MSPLGDWQLAIDHPSGVAGSVATQQLLLRCFECSEGHTVFSAFAKMSVKVKTVLTIQTQEGPPVRVY